MTKNLQKAAHTVTTCRVLVEPAWGKEHQDGMVSDAPGTHVTFTRAGRGHGPSVYGVREGERECWACARHQRSTVADARMCWAGAGRTFVNYFAEGEAKTKEPSGRRERRATDPLPVSPPPLRTPPSLDAAYRARNLVSVSAFFTGDWAGGQEATTQLRERASRCEKSKP